MLVPVVTEWSRRMKLPASQLMMPLSFAAMIGGVLKALRENGYSKPVIGLHYSQAPDVMEVAGLSDFAYQDFGLLNSVRGIYLVPPNTPVHYYIEVLDVIKVDQ